MATKVITVPGYKLGFTIPYSVSSFGGTAFHAPNVVIDRPPGDFWDNALSDSSATTDMDSLYDLIISHLPTVDWLIVATHSRGSQVACKLFRERMGDLLANVDPEKILWMLSGNPERKYNGGSVVNYAVKTPIYPGSGGYGVGYGLPLAGTGPFRMLDIARQYDEWADYPNDFTNTAAMDTINGIEVHSAYSAAPELGLDGFPVDWAEWGRYDEGNVSYLTCSTYPFPLGSPAMPAATIWERLGGGVLGRNRNRTYAKADDRARAAAESAWRRPMAVKIPNAR